MATVKKDIYTATLHIDVDKTMKKKEDNVLQSPGYEGRLK
jgi:hypothetical protein